MALLLLIFITFILIIWLCDHDIQKTKIRQLTLQLSDSRKKIDELSKYQTIMNVEAAAQQIIRAAEKKAALIKLEAQKQAVAIIANGKKAMEES